MAYSKNNNYQTTGFLSQEMVYKIINSNNSSIKEEIISDDIFLEKAKNINSTLHKGAINKRNRAKVLASLLLALADDEYLKINETLIVLIGDINSIVVNILTQHKKESLVEKIKLNQSTSKDNYKKYIQALVMQFKN